MPERLVVDMELNANDYIKAIKKATEYTAEFEKKNNNSLNSMVKIANVGDKVITSLDQQIDKYTTLKTTVQDATRVVDGATEEYKQYNYQLSQNRAAMDKDIEKQKELSKIQKKVNEQKKEFAKERRRADEIQKVERLNAANGKLIRTYTFLDKEGRKVTQTLTLMGNKIVNTERKISDAAIKTSKERKREAQAVEELKKKQERLIRTQKALAKQRIGQDIKPIVKYDAATGRLTKTFEGLDKSGRKVTHTISYMNGKLVNVSSSQSKLTKKTKTATDEIKRQTKATKGLTISMKGALQLVGVQLARRAVSFFIREVTQAVAESAELYKRIGEIQTISQEVPITFAKWKEQLREVSDLTGFDAIDTAEAAYQTLSNQVAKGAEVFRFQAEAAKFARVTNSSLADSVNLLSSALNSYGQDASEADRISAQLFKTIELGRIRASEIANTVGRVTVVASQLGISLDEVNALLALTTQKGLKARQAMTQVRGVMNGLLKPTKAMSEFFESLGFNSAEAAIAQLGFKGVLKEMAKATKGQASELVKLIPRVRGLSAALVAINENGEEYEKILGQMVGAQEDYNKAVEIVTNNTGVKFEKYMNRVKNTFLDFGGLLQEGIVWWADYFTGATYATEKITKANELELREFKKNLRERIDAFKESEESKSKIYIDALTKRNKELTAGLDENEKVLEQTATKTKEVFGVVVKELEESSTALTNNIKKAEKSITDLTKGSRSFEISVKETIFDEKLSRATANERIRLIREELVRTERIRVAAARAGDESIAQEQIKRKKELTERLVKIDAERVAKIKEVEEKIAEEKRKIQEASDEKQTKARQKTIKEAQDNIKELEKTRQENLDETTGQYTKSYEKLYLDLIELSKRQEEEIKNIKLRQIEDLEQKQMASIAKVAAFRLKLAEVENLESVDALAEMDKDDRNEALKERAKIYEEAADIAKSLNNEEQKANIIATLRDKEQLERTRLKLKLEKQLAIQRQQDLAKNKEETEKAIDSIKTEQIEIENTILDIRKAAAVASDYMGELIPRSTIDTWGFSENFIKQITEVYSILDKLQEGGFSTNKKEIEAIQVLLDTMKTIRKRENLNKLFPVGTDAKISDLLVKITQAREKFKELTGEETGTIEAQKSIQESILKLQDNLLKKKDDEISKNKQINKLIKERQGLLRPIPEVRLPVPQIQTKAKGGMMYGQDRISALLSPGEYVMNAGSARKFYSQLVGMNSRNNNIQSYNKGGNVNVGDVNINMTSSGNEDYDIQKIGRGLQRAIRRRTLSLQ